MDGPEEGAPIDRTLRKEALKAILDGAAIFFPDKQSRRDKLFSMMVRRVGSPAGRSCSARYHAGPTDVPFPRPLLCYQKNISAEDQPESLKLTFESLCNYFR